jgi:hypothetical protein
MALLMVVPLVDAIVGGLGSGNVFEGGVAGVAGVAGVKSWSEGGQYLVLLRLVPR